MQAALVGALVMLASDLVAQHLLPATQLPVGVVTGALGALFLIYLLVAANRAGQGRMTLERQLAPASRRRRCRSAMATATSSTNSTSTIPPGKLTVIVGANACGKSTLLRGLARLLDADARRRLLDGKSIHQMPTREVATILGVLPQTPDRARRASSSPISSAAAAIRIRAGSATGPPEDDAAVAEALAATDTLDLADRPVDELSGGQRQRVWIAMALAQETDLLLLDEPTTFLDINHQVEVLDLLTDLVPHDGRTVVVVLHDLNLACRYADHIVAMKAGRSRPRGRHRKS